MSGSFTCLLVARAVHGLGSAAIAVAGMGRFVTLIISLLMIVNIAMLMMMNISMLMVMTLEIQSPAQAGAVGLTASLSYRPEYKIISKSSYKILQTGV